MSISVIDKFTFLKKALWKINSRKWTEPTGIALCQTASLLEEMVDFKPIVAVLGGALSLASILLNCEYNLMDLKEEKKELDSAKCHFTGVVEKALQWRLEDIQERLSDPNKEVIDNSDILKTMLQSDFTEISLEMTLIEKDISKLMHTDDALFDDINDPDFEHAIKSIESSYLSFQNGAYNLCHYFSSTNYYIFHLQTLTAKSFNPIQIWQYLDIVYKRHGVDACHQLMTYVVVLLSKYLQLITAFFLCSNDPKRAVFEFERYNNFCNKYFSIYKKLTGHDFLPRKRLTERSPITSQSNKYLLPDVAKITTSEHATEIRKYDDPSMQDVTQLLENTTLSNPILMFGREKRADQEILHLTDSPFHKRKVTNFEDRSKFLQASSKLHRRGKYKWKTYQSF